MRKKAKEIQRRTKHKGEAVRQFRACDYVYAPDHSHSGRGWSVIREHDDAFYGDDYGDIWLPCQDQLQEMLDIPKGTIHKKQSGRCGGKLAKYLAFEIGYFANQDYEIHPKEMNYIDLFDSMEQLWLALVMKERYGKVWNGENWIKGNAKDLSLTIP